ncbi:MAG TPA: type II toxin-antitoxin system VapC family toxin [Phytomonospora sp.]
MTAQLECGLLDTCVLIDLASLPQESLPPVSAISMISLAELHVGVNTATDAEERAGRTVRLHEVTMTFDAFPFDEVAAQCYGVLYAFVEAAGRNPRPRKMDLLIAATAMANKLPLYTRNANDFKGLERALTVVAV